MVVILNALRLNPQLDLLEEGRSDGHQQNASVVSDVWKIFSMFVTMHHKYSITNTMCSANGTSQKTPRLCVSDKEQYCEFISVKL